MGAFDVVCGWVGCPDCGTRFSLAEQTKFLLPDFASYGGRGLTLGAPQPIDFEPEELLGSRVWDDRWVRVREAGAGGDLRCSLLLDVEDLTECHCGAPLVFVAELAFRGAPERTVTLERLRAVDARTAAASEEIDFADGEEIVFGEGLSVDGLDGLSEALEELAELPEGGRKRRLGAALRASMARRAEGDPEALAPYTYVRGPMRCGACGDVRERTGFTFLSHPFEEVSFFGERWAGGVLRPGTVLPVALAALDDSRDRGVYARLRPPAGRGEITVLHLPSTWGCACGAGRASVWLRFVEAAGGVTLAEMEARAVRGERDLDDVDFVEATSITHGATPPGMARPPRPELDRAGIVRWMLPSWTGAR